MSKNQAHKNSREMLNSLPEEWGDTFRQALDEIKKLESQRNWDPQTRLNRAVEILEGGQAIEPTDFSDLLSEIWVYGLDAPHIILKYNKFLIDNRRKEQHGLDGAWYPPKWVKSKKRVKLGDRRGWFSDTENRDHVIFAIFIACQKLGIANHIGIIKSFAALDQKENLENPNSMYVNTGIIKKTLGTYKQRYEKLICK